MKRVLILLLFVLVVGCGRFDSASPLRDTGPDSNWECPSCSWGVEKWDKFCPNCGDVFNYENPIRRR